MRFAEFWQTVAQRLDTPAMQEGTWAAGRIWPGWLAPEAAKMPTGEQWGRVLIEPGRGVAPAVLTSANIETVRFVVVSEVNDFEPEPGTTFDPLVPLEQMQEEAKRLLDGWHPEPFTDPQIGLTIAVRVKLEIPRHKSPQWDSTERLHWISSTYRFEAARR
jgi:hypothetical protein